MTIVIATSTERAARSTRLVWSRWRSTRSTRRRRSSGSRLTLRQRHPRSPLCGALRARPWSAAHAAHASSRAEMGIRPRPLPAQSGQGLRNQPRGIDQLSAVAEGSTQSAFCRPNDLDHCRSRTERTCSRESDPHRRAGYRGTFKSYDHGVACATL